MSAPLSEMPIADPTGTDPREFGDELLASGKPVVRTPDGEVLVLGQELVREVATNPDTYSSAVSAHLQLPNGLDGQRHRQFRTLIEGYLTPEALADVQPRFESAARNTVNTYAGRGTVDAVGELGYHFAVNAMLQWLGWPAEFGDRLVDWVAANNAANRSGDRSRTAQVAADFDTIITDVVQPLIDQPTDSVTSQLVHDTSLGRRLDFDEIVSILRNWTGGDLSSMAYCIGVIAHGLAKRPDVQQQLRDGFQGSLDDDAIDTILDEFLRIDSPFVTNRRITAAPVVLGGFQLGKGQRLRVVWTSANRDPLVVKQPDEFNPRDNLQHNLTWGAGPHECPGRYLSMMELRAIIGAILSDYEITLVGDGKREVYPSGGWASRPVELKAL